MNKVGDISMTAKRLFLEIGTGNDLQGANYTKAAVRAVEDAIHHSYLSFVWTMNLDVEMMEVEVVVGVQKPDQIDVSAVAAALPYGRISVKPVEGGLDVPGDRPGETTVIASAAVIVRYDLPA